ncbi:DUF2946 domain-containing protein [Pseudoduganella lutea]|uniref:DUF2946 domain-containing protein n=1 Tax=Pseudoduganella lutea TaxID=321985 RepID=A0A4P6L2K1_9BURK|nr:DUF2946 domain-containing protein [Pseudoduganella lutea]QBE65072.1 DUF2946 domain-containing protein [Pseudoduganella lutea]
MFKTRQWRACFTWLAFIAVLAAALMPSVSRALASDRAGNIMMAEICAPSGMNYAAMSDAAMAAAGMVEPDDKRMGHMDDCAWCRLQADTPALPGTVLAVAPGEIAAPRPPLFYHSPTPLFTWAAAQPRGPPLLA